MSARSFYLRLWREPDDGTSWPFIRANFKFAMFNCCVAFVALCVRVALNWLS